MPEILIGHRLDNSHHGQDALAYDPRRSRFAVADGVSTQKFSSHASEAAVAEALRGKGRRKRIESTANSVVAINNEFGEAATTLVCAEVRRKHLGGPIIGAFGIGDSIFVHARGQRVVRQSVVDEVKGKQNILTSYLGANGLSGRRFVDGYNAPFHEGDTVGLFTDGITKALGADQLAEIMYENLKNPQLAVEDIFRGSERIHDDRAAIVIAHQISVR